MGRSAGRPVVTTHEAIERAAFELFRERGYDATTTEDIARRVGIGRRTLFRYFPSKNDIAWGRFDEALGSFADLLAKESEDVMGRGGLVEAVGRAVRAFNAFPDEVRDQHEERMRLILGTPALQAHSALRYRDWRRVIELHVARVMGVGEQALVPQLYGQVFLGIALAAYDQWLLDPSTSLDALLKHSVVLLASGLGAEPIRSAS